MANFHDSGKFFSTMALYKMLQHALFIMDMDHCERLKNEDQRHPVRASKMNAENHSRALQIRAESDSMVYTR